MMFSVIWNMRALLQLQRIELESGRADAIQQAVAYVDYTLRRYPLDMGESRDGTDRLWYSDVLGVYYGVFDETGKVVVFDVAKAIRR